ncbi:cache domain-containing sensor histidine kinase [Paenibacillus eucommiae]|uniref:histidine kinase n=1 Tax=Paenibacillus eucommiae TaxID=1355755 RepID=A0ABS4J3K5_9BACL|nr:sensor histidine kinase [Paenibacillus eucommiae]MBP1994422.1 sensor histidine kinase YesM [Paenibacillus eucommiae]
MNARNPFTLLMQALINTIRRLNIFKRLVLSFLLVIIVPNIVISYVLFDISSEELETTVSNSLYQYIGTVNNNINEVLKKYEDISYRLYSDEELVALLVDSNTLNHIKESNPTDYKEKYEDLKKRINAILYRTSINRSLLSNLQIISDTDEFTQINYNGEVKGGKVKQIIAFRKSPTYTKAIEAKGYPVWLDTSAEYGFENQLMSGMNLGSYITLARAIPDGNGGTLGVIVMNISVNVFLNIVESKDVVNNGNLLLLGDSGAKVSLNENVSGPFLRKDVSDEIFKQKNGRFIDKKSGDLVVFQDSAYTGWELAFLVPRESLLSSVYKIRNIIIQISIICIGIAVLISYGVTLSISTPLMKLKRAMGMIYGKNTETKYEDPYEDEIGLLGRKFNHMMERINHLISSVYKVELIKQDEELRRRAAELDALQMQINPHFLYNTLDMIRWEVALQENGDGHGSQMIKAFADLLRLGTKANHTLVQVEEEFRHIEAYMKVMKYKHGDSIRWACDIEDEAAGCLIAKLTLQPLVENALLHGFTGKTGDKSVSIRAYKELDELFIVVSDNGKGIDPEMLEQLNRKLQDDRIEGNQIGLHNVNARLKLYFGKKYGLMIQSEAGSGTRVIVKLPCLRQEPKIEEVTPNV